ncbi:MAG: sugar phosphate isomerase/epimerase [Armatimonadetes bacterium]|jgi:sugar phosphate isomerase/epimerase|nr:sugar phosphate isomerase/epimerase [Armatimonadota bacterium]MDI9585539.1 sugar phosphate isomerase/epimerase [Acidobacteriota bacterium]
MKVGMLTAPFSGDDLDTVISFAKSAGFDACEVRVGAKHCDLSGKFDAGKFKAAFDEAGIEVSSLAAYINITAGDEAERKMHQDTLNKALSVCEKIGVDVLCTMAGLPPAGMSKEDCIRDMAAPYYRKFCKKAADKGIKIAMENWYATNIQHLGQWDMIFELVDADNFGLNFDPSHLYWQDIDYLLAVERYASRIFHTHAKDTEVVAHKKAFVGSQAGGWWRYVIPGFGDIDWGVYCARLRRNGFNGVLSIEHEDSALGREEGFKLGLDFLRQFADGS